MVGVVNLVVLTCLLGVMTKKVVNFLGEEKCTCRENRSYAYAGLVDSPMMFIQCGLIIPLGNRWKSYF